MEDRIYLYILLGLLGAIAVVRILLGFCAKMGIKIRNK
jgi:hypothetical protein